MVDCFISDCLYERSGVCHEKLLNGNHTLKEGEKYKCALVLGDIGVIKQEKSGIGEKRDET